MEFNSDKMDGYLDFWGLGWLGIFVWDYELEKQLLILLEPHQEEEKNKAFEVLRALLKSNKMPNK